MGTTVFIIINCILFYSILYENAWTTEPDYTHMMLLVKETKHIGIIYLIIPILYQSGLSGEQVK